MDVSEVTRLSPAAQKQILAKMGKQAKENKLHNVPTSRCLQGGKLIRFPSQREARRFDQLMLQLRAWMIRDLKLQQCYTLQAAYITPEGERVRGITYRADFSYERATAPDAIGEVGLLAAGGRGCKGQANRRLYHEKEAHEGTPGHFHRGCVADGETWK